MFGGGGEVASTSTSVEESSVSSSSLVVLISVMLVGLVGCVVTLLMGASRVIFFLGVFLGGRVFFGMR